jgi:hypothetical protein
LSARICAQFHKAQPAAFSRFVNPGNFRIYFDTVTLLGKFEFQKDCLVHAHWYNAFETQPALAEVSEDGAIIRAEIPINQPLYPAARVESAPRLRRRRG